jgi:hypothetical protein
MLAALGQLLVEQQHEARVSGMTLYHTSVVTSDAIFDI